ncbi:hypothetical protein B7P43_G05947 [Cryptotermes secundus]|uniref:Uncharacterized protein n=1 Tax=Cryptotermes secundus TaxID=105785 RepID=A0A2J7PUM0_9NEOP|nr:hypothetical protein B7P43_G05947 [Cryptotermes secundus]
MAEEILNYKIDSAGVQEVRWDEGGIAPARNYTFFYGNGNENHEFRRSFFVHQRILLEVKRVELLTVKSTIFQHRNIHKFTWITPDGKIHSQTDHILLHRRRHSSILDVHSFRVADYDTDHYLLVAKVRERLTSKQTTHRVQIFGPKRDEVTGG